MEISVTITETTMRARPRLIQRLIAERSLTKRSIDAPVLRSLNARGENWLIVLKTVRRT